MTIALLRILPQALVLSVLTTIAVLALPAPAVAQDTVYEFSGSCSDCQNTGNGVLTLQDYTPGALLSAGNFVSFSYSSNLLTFDITQSELDFDTIGIPGTTPFVSGLTTTSLGLSGALGATAGPADFYLNASVTEGNTAYSINFDSCVSAVCGSGLTGPGAWNILAEAVGNSQLPGGLQTKTNDYGYSHTWTPASAIAAPEIDAGSALGGITLLILALALLGDRETRTLRPIR
jgi:hypothetical protein